METTPGEKRPSVSEVLSSKASFKHDDKTVRSLTVLMALALVAIIGGLLYCQQKMEKGGSDAGTVPAAGNQSQPEAPAGVDQETAAKTEDEKNIETIQNYYALLSSQKLDEAYTMRAKADVSLEEFKGWYQNTEYAWPGQFKVEDGHYDFIVGFKEKGEEEKAYGVRMTVQGGKLSTASSREFTPVSVEQEGYKAFSVVRGDKIYLILSKDGKETVVDRGDYSKKALDTGFYIAFNQVKFSSKGAYLLYHMSSFEYAGGKVYDIKAGKLSLAVDGVELGDGFDMTPDEKYVYACLGIGMMETIPGRVYAVPGFKKVFDVEGKYGMYRDSSCSYDDNVKKIVFQLSDPAEEGRAQEVTVSYPEK
jgi:hypothetical protein